MPRNALKNSLVLKRKKPVQCEVCDATKEFSAHADCFPDKNRCPWCLGLRVPGKNTHVPSIRRNVFEAIGAITESSLRETPLSKWDISATGQNIPCVARGRRKLENASALASPKKFSRVGREINDQPVGWWYLGEPFANQLDFVKGDLEADGSYITMRMDFEQSGYDSGYISDE